MGGGKKRIGRIPKGENKDCRAIPNAAASAKHYYTHVKYT